MDVFDRVVVGVDGTEYGFEALRQTLVLTPATTVVRAVTALDTSVAVHAGFDMSHISALLEKEAALAHETANEIIDERPNCTTAIVRGDAKTVLRTASSKPGVTLLALGARSSSRFLGILAGETATSLLHEAACSVFFARPRWGTLWRPMHIVVGLDGSESSLAALVVADDLTSRLGASVKVVSATGGKLLDEDGAWADRVTSWDPGHPVVCLLDRSLHADLVMVGSRGLHGLRSLGSVSERVAHRALCSVLVVRTPPSDGPSSPARSVRRRGLNDSQRAPSIFRNALKQSRLD